MIRHNRLLVTFHVTSDALLATCAFIVAYALRFHSGLIPITRGLPPLAQYLNVAPFIAILVPLGFQLQGLYRLRRGRSRVDDFFAVFVGSILAVVFGIVATLYVQTYFATEEAKDAGAYEVSQLVWGLFLGLNVLLTFASRELVREDETGTLAAETGAKCGFTPRCATWTRSRRTPCRCMRSSAVTCESAMIVRAFFTAIASSFRAVR